MPRSPLTDKFLRIVALRDEVKSWPQDEQDFFLDMLAPEPEQKKSATKKASKKSSKSSRPETERIFKRCDTCGLTKRADVHKDSELGGYHEFKEKKSERATGIGQQLSKRREQGREVVTTKDDDYGIALCGASLASSGANCSLPEGHALHADKGYVDYHPFRPSAPPAPTRLPANGASSATERSTRRSAPSTTPESDGGESGSALSSVVDSEAGAASAGAATGGSSE